MNRKTQSSVTPSIAWGGSDYILAEQAASASGKPGKAKHERRRRDMKAAHAVAAERRALRVAAGSKARAVPAFPMLDDAPLFPSTDDDGGDGSRMLAGWL